MSLSRAFSLMMFLTTIAFAATLAAQQNDTLSPSRTGALKLPAFGVVRTGRAFGEGNSTPFPKKGSKVIFGQTILFGDSRDDGYLDIARSTDGHRLFTRIGTDDGDESSSTFELKVHGKLPAGAVLQMVDGYVTFVREQEMGLGSTTFRWGDKVMKQHFEAWLAFPKEGMIVRPLDKTRYPLLPAIGAYKESKASEAQWVVYVPDCKETKSACVYYGPPALACGHFTRAGHTEGQGLIAHPAKCP